MKGITGIEVTQGLKEGMVIVRNAQIVGLSDGHRVSVK